MPWNSGDERDFSCKIDELSEDLPPFFNAVKVPIRVDKSFRKVRQIESSVYQNLMETKNHE